MTVVDVALVVVHRLADSGREFLVALRSPGRDGYWSLIAGRVEDGESAEEAALRELEEETGLTTLLSFADIPMTLGFELDGAWNVVHVFAAEAPRDWEPTLNDEHVDSRWCTAEEALDVLHFEEPRAALQEVARRLGAPA